MPAEWDGVKAYVKQIQLGGRGGGKSDYLIVPGRIAWFNHTQDLDASWAHPPMIATEVVQIDLAKREAVVKATAMDCTGRSATAHGWETGQDFDRGYVQKAETIAIGRALALLGYNTQAALETDFAEGTERDGTINVADTPVQRRKDQGGPVRTAEDEGAAHLASLKDGETPPIPLLIRMAAAYRIKWSENMPITTMAAVVARKLGSPVDATPRAVYDGLLALKGKTDGTGT